MCDSVLLVVDFKAQLTSAELKNKRLMEAFKKTSLQFRKVCYQLLGYRIDLLSDNQFKLQNMYAESPEDVLLFQVRFSLSFSLDMCHYLCLGWRGVRG